MDAFDRFIADMREHREMLTQQIDYLEKGNQIHMVGETAEVSTARFLARLRQHKSDLDDLIPQCEAMRVNRTP